ncbi:MAG: Ig-like domain-containing protein [Puniceicoccaceae bacterium]
MNNSCKSLLSAVALLYLLTVGARAQVPIPAEYISVGDYSGTANQRISAAIAAAGATDHKTVFFPNGTYALQSTINLNQGATTELYLIGESREGVFLIPDIPYLEANYNGGDWQNGGARLAHMMNLSSGSVFTSVDVSIQNMTIDMRHQLVMGEETITYNVVGHGIRIGQGWQAGQFTVNHVTIRNVGSYGVGIQDRDGHPKNNITLTNLHLERVGSDGIDTKEASGDGNRNLVIRNVSINEVGFLDTGAAPGIDLRYRDVIIENVNLVSRASRSTLPGQTSSVTGINFRPWDGGLGVVGATVSNVYIRGSARGIRIHAADDTPHQNIAISDFKIQGQIGTGVDILGTNHSGHTISDGYVDPAFGGAAVSTNGQAVVSNVVAGRWDPALTPLTDTTFERNVSFAGETYSPAWIGMVGSERVSLNPTSPSAGLFAFDVGEGGLMRIDYDGLYNGMDKLIVEGTLNLDGELVINIIGGSPATGGTFQIFEADAITGSFDTITLPTVLGLTWFTDNLSTDGTISLLSETQAPTISTLSPADNATDVIASANLVATFHKPVQAGTGFITIRKLIDDSIVSLIDVTNADIVTFNGTQMTIDPSVDFNFETSYYVTIDATAVKDLDGNAFAGISGTSSWNFTTGTAVKIVQINSASKVVAESLSSSSTALLFDAGQFADTLVVALSSEKSGGDYSVMYDGHPLSAAVLGGQADIWYLDLGTTSYSGGNAEIVIDYSEITTVNGVGIGAVSISSEGKPIQLHTTAISAAGADSVNLTTTLDGAFVMVCFNANRGGSITGDTLLTPIYESGDTGSAQGAAGYETDVAAGDHTYSWTVTNPRKVTAASFVIANDYANWIAEYSLEGYTDLTDDPDGDRIPNGLEALFGTHPGQPSQGLDNFTADGTTLSFAHPHNENPPVDLSLLYRWSTNLQDWYECDGVDGPPGGTTLSAIIETADMTTTVTADASEPMEHLFLRARVIQEQ